MKLLLSILIAVLAVAQTTAAPASVEYRDSLPLAPDSISVAATPVLVHEAIDATDNPYAFRWRQLLVPGVLITAGAVGMRGGWFRVFNDEMPPGHGDSRSTPLDDIVQYTPYATLYALKICGVRSRHNFGGTTLLLAMASAFAAVTVRTTKELVTEWRPDGSQPNSFPSGHTATAFLGAELMRMEYGATNRWIAYSGYAVAVATGALRVIHNRHWFTDVMAGAGIGILSVRAAYWLYPLVTKAIFPSLYKRDVGLSAYPVPGGAAVGLALRF